MSDTPPPIQMDAATAARVERDGVDIRTEPVPGSSMPRLLVYAIVDAPIEKVWQAIDQSEHYDRFMPRVKKSQEVSRQGDVVRTRLTIDMPFPLKNLSATTEATHTVVPGERYVRQWRLVEGDYKSNDGSWTFEPREDGRTLARYEILVIPNVRIPKKIQSLVQERAIPGLVEALTKRARSL